jgi:hypothetical protein
MVHKSMKYVLSTLLLGAWLGGTVVAHAQNQTLEGVISNTHCGLDHSKADPNAAGCVNGCITAQNAKYALVVGDKVYTLEGGSQAEIQKLAGLNAKVTGRVDGNTIHVSAVAPGKAAEGDSGGHSMGCM